MGCGDCFNRKPETQNDILASHWAAVSTGVFIQHKRG